MFVNTATIPSWKTIEPSSSELPSNSRILCQTKISDGLMIMLLEKNGFRNNPEEMIEDKDTKISSLILFNIERFTFSALKWRIYAHGFFRQDPDSFSMFCEGKDLVICSQDSSEMLVIKFKLSENYEILSNTSQKTCNKVENDMLKKAVLYNQKICMHSFDNISKGIFSTEKKERFITIDINTGERKEYIIENPLPNPRNNYCSILFKNEIFLFGGELAASFRINHFTDMWAFNIDSLTWRNISDKFSFVKKFENQACVYADKIYMLGISTDDDSKDQESGRDGFVYNITNETVEVFTAQNKLKLQGSTSYTLASSQTRLFVIYEDEKIMYLPLSKSKTINMTSFTERIFSENAITDQMEKNMNLFAERPFPDITFLVEGKKIPAHRAILDAGCRYFKNMFREELEEQLEPEVINIPTMKARVFECLLEYIYCTNVRLTQDIAWELFEEADNYYLPDLKRICENFLISNLTAENVLQAVDFAERNEATKLKSAALEYMIKNSKNVFVGEGLMQLQQSTLLEICRLKLNQS